MKKPIYERKWFIGLLIFLVLGGIIKTMDEEEATNKSAAEVQDEELDLGEEISDIIYKIIGKEEDKEDSIISLSVGNGSTRVVMREIPISTKTYKTELLTNSKRILERLTEFEELEFINLEWQGKFTDKYGNSDWNPVMRIDMKRETLDKINWKDFSKDNIENIADDYWQHKNLD